jgi:hypothetical protein
LTSSAEEEIFFSNFARCSFVRNKSNDASEDPEAQLSDPDGKFTYHLLTTADDSAEDNDTQQVEGLFSLWSSALNNSCPSASPRDDSSVLHNESDMGTGIVYPSAK